jgi:PleD family two-component response regulator
MTRATHMEWICGSDVALMRSGDPRLMLCRRRRHSGPPDRAIEDEAMRQEPDTRDAAARNAVARDFTGMRVLLVGERRDDQIARILARDEHEVLSAEDPEAAVRLSAVFDPEVIVVVGAAGPDLRRVAPSAGIIALVPGQNVAERVSALQAGADDCLASPWSDAELRARVRAMGRRRARVWQFTAAGSAV